MGFHLEGPGKSRPGHFRGEQRFLLGVVLAASIASHRSVFCHLLIHIIGLVYKFMLSCFLSYTLYLTFKRSIFGWRAMWFIHDLACTMKTSVFHVTLSLDNA